MNLIRIAWGILAVVLIGFAIFEDAKYGGVAIAVLVVFAILPDLSLIGAFAGSGRLRPDRVRLYNLAHAWWLPVALVVASLAVPVPGFGWGLRPGLEIFLAGLAWLAHIAVDRAVGYGLRAPDGSIRPVGRPYVPAGATRGGDA